MLTGLSFLASDPLPLYKAVALLAVVASSTLLLVSYGVERREAMPLAALLVAPSVILWTFAGLETPLLAAIVMAMAAIYAQMERGNARRLPVLGALAGLAVLTRYDAVLFAGPVLLAALAQTGQWKQRMMAVALAGVPLVSLVCLRMAALRISAAYLFLHQDSNGRARCRRGESAVHGRASAHRRCGRHGGVCNRPRGDERQERDATVVEELRAHWGLHAGSCVGARLRRQHGDRAHDVRVPSLHAVFRRDWRWRWRISPGGRTMASTARASIRVSYAAAAAALLILLVHALHAEAMYRRSLQGLGTFGEYGEQGVAGYARDYVPAMMKNAADVRAHWSTTQ